MFKSFHRLARSRRIKRRWGIQNPKGFTAFSLKTESTHDAIAKEKHQHSRSPPLEESELCYEGID